MRQFSKQGSADVSPSIPSFSPPLNLFPQPPRATSSLSAAFLPRAKPRGTPNRAVSPFFVVFTPNRSLTPLSTAFTQTHRDVGAAFALSRHSSLATSLALCFHTIANSLSL